MRILIDIGHPAHVHLFKNMVLDMQKRGHVFIFTVREGENEKYLLEALGFNYLSIGKKQKGLINKIIGIIFFTWRIFRISFKFKADLFLSHGSMYAGYAAFFVRKPHIAVEDSGNMEQIRLSRPVSDVIITPDILGADLGKKQIRYKGYHELMYLTPKYFTPNNSILHFLGVLREENYAILRFVSWEASHDSNQIGLSLTEKIDLVNELSKKMRVFISGERKLPDELEPFRIKIPFERMHDALAFAYVYIGEGATMASEAGILGTPSIYISSIERCYNTDQEKYGTVLNLTPSKDSISAIMKFVENIDHVKVQDNRKKLLESKIDSTAFLVWFVENYPQSFKIMKENQDYQLRFK